MHFKKNQGFSLENSKGGGDPQRFSTKKSLFLNIEWMQNFKLLMVHTFFGSNL